MKKILNKNSKDKIKTFLKLKEFTFEELNSEDESIDSENIFDE